MENFNDYIHLDTYRRAFRFCQILGLPAPEAGQRSYPFDVRAGMIDLPVRGKRTPETKQHPVSRAQWERAVKEIELFR